MNREKTFFFLGRKDKRAEMCAKFAENGVSTKKKSGCERGFSGGQWEREKVKDTSKRKVG